MTSWEVILDDPYQRVRRFAVPGGWLYQVEAHGWSHRAGLSSDSTEGWHPPVFVADMAIADPELSDDDIRLINRALGAFASDHPDAPVEEIEDLRLRLGPSRSTR